MRTATLLLVLAFWATACSGQSDHKYFRLVGYEATQRYTGLRFEAKADWRTVVFIDGSDGGLAIRGPKVEGFLEWSDLKVVRAVPSKSNRLKLLMLEWTDHYDHSKKVFECGYIDENHLEDLKRRYSRYLKFESP